VREALFSIVGQDLSGWSMLDPCGGSGLVALEAASRGASPVTVYERDPSAASAVRRNADALGLAVTLRAADSRKAALPEADLVFLDPPYRDDIGVWLHLLAPYARRLLVAEAKAGAAWPELAGFEREKERAYGDTVLSVYVRQEASAPAP
jgi:16S rRNA (guanine(966)-N(2))-methyltransferase RsmD